jgi:hypothetical protein
MCKVPRNRREMATYTPEEIRLVLRAADNDRKLPLDEGLVGVLKRASAQCAQERLALGEAHAGSGYGADQ